MENKICCIFNYAPHYRSSIYELMDKELRCDFYFGDTVFMELKKLDYSKLQSYKGELKTIKLRSYRWQLGISKFLFRNYDSYIITGDPGYLSYWFLLLICIIRHKKIYMWCHGLKLQPSTKRGDLLAKIFYNNASGGLLLYGNYSRNLMIEEGYPEDKLHVIYNSLDHENQYKIRQKQKAEDIYFEHFRNNDPVVIFIGRLNKEKKLRLIIESQKKLIEKGIFLNSVFIGSGEMEQPLRDMTKEYGLIDKVWFYGSCYDEQQIAKLIYNATLTISPGNIGLTALHSLVYGTPVITHSNIWNHGPEFEAITRGETGDFFDEDDVNDIVMKVSSWIKQSQNKREIVRNMCYEKVDLWYNPDFQIKLLKRILK